MAKTQSGPIILDCAVALGGEAPLKQAIQANPTLYKAVEFPVTTWPANGTRLNYPVWSSRADWDPVNERIVSVMKRQNGNAGALHWYLPATDTWEQKWAGYPNSNNLYGHPYDSWCVNHLDGSVWWIDWDGGVRKWQGPSNTNSDWALQFTPSGNFIMNNSTSKPHAIGFIEDWWGSGDHGLVLMKSSSSAHGRMGVCHEDGTGMTEIFTGTGNGATNFYEPLVHRFPYWDGLLVVESNGHTKTGASYENALAPISIGMYIVAGTAASPSVVRLPDPPSGRLGWNSNGDKIVVYKEFIYLYRSGSTASTPLGSVYVLDTLHLQYGWTLVVDATFGPHGLNPNGLYINYVLCSLEDYGGAIALAMSKTTTSEALGETPVVYRLKYETL